MQLEVSGIRLSYGSFLALDDVSIALRQGEFLALLGPSGSGKSSLLRVVAGFHWPQAGSVRIAGADVTRRPPRQRNLGMVFQSYALFPHMTAAENVGFGLKRGLRGARVPELLAVVGLDGLGTRYPYELSGGQQQRVALARALAPSPELVLLDEPWSNVDPFLRETLRAEVAEIIRPLGVTVVLVTHDREEAFSLADRIALMRDGRVIQEGTSEELYYAPVSRWAAEFVGAANVLPGEVRSGLVETALGAFPANGSAGATAGVEVLVRPELLELQPDPHGAGEVVGREFRGHDVLYRVLLDGVELVSQRPSTEVVPMGARVSIRLHDGHAPVLG